MSDIVLRVNSPGGRVRLTLKATDTVGTLRQKIAEHCHIEPAQQELHTNQQLTQPITAADDASLTHAGVRHGDLLWLKVTGGAKVEIRGDAIAPAAKMKIDDLPPLPPKDASKTGGGGASDAGKQEGGASAPASRQDSVGSGGSHPPQGGGGGGGVDGEKKDEPKFKNFDQFLHDNGYNVIDLPFHRTFTPITMEMGRMTKLPPAVTLKHQPYRHVDHLELMNISEMQNFCSYWTDKCELATQRGGWLYGYYVEDSHYPMGMRAVLEAIYEPPQVEVGEGIQFLDDPFHATVEAVAGRLGLERIGYIFTHLPRDELLTSDEIQKIARLQLDHLSDKHFTSYPVSKFVTLTIAPDPNSAMGAAGAAPNAFMISDLGMAFVRDGVLGMSPDPRHLQLKPRKKHEIMAQILESGHETDKFDVDWLIVRVNESAPRRARSMFKHAIFPRENRQPNETQSRAAVREYLKKVPSSEPSWHRYADFHLLIYIADLFDRDTAFVLCDAIRHKTEVDPNLQEILSTLPT
ncbi:unnamed protein product [Vitrella brassicaformis CCMP3155]|uniref:Ubiquitin-like domain-containing protein n=1 Tax=Vitrella brassicaformis (strain CCMP3155) TaxID=1169540 RepID=A0A0G4FLW6_VITBC|nr:unnamed protein product [Vitrella brassicaformis CCMP3155]|mmetsp:Transcript_21548/g.61364  ORF Transcript_21548/g.61364 Transcript_21548/m.61364 type:complete len:520 (+) Transcript_21548:230-1789(+)|eukprot:CEM15003.1 unnamed protein product [Vitrella brassicaformis CCMP3155]